MDKPAEGKVTTGEADLLREPTDDELMEALWQAIGPNRDARILRDLYVVDWKDGIDIDKPSSLYRTLARLIRANCRAMIEALGRERDTKAAFALKVLEEREHMRAVYVTGMGDLREDLTVEIKRLETLHTFSYDRAIEAETKLADAHTENASLRAKLAEAERKLASHKDGKPVIADRLTWPRD